ncbi:MAG TPA: hypothetical protein VFK37_07970 [Bacillales bacterium]|nr:hypothetical protein [Bacillales bacterium]
MDEKKAKRLKLMLDESFRPILERLDSIEKRISELKSIIKESS